ncbi:hypothetical protein A4A49_33237 [Nicotiana attenuata]|uniref:Uncharacterized protein n=1 Tax=Nicotiana attenuata TaxID=49451 RepID=A0A1J6J037_NICAT|nr:hypothetical protein A4A49_33237 [Nicotiana attenuata]
MKFREARAYFDSINEEICQSEERFCVVETLLVHEILRSRGIFRFNQRRFSNEILYGVFPTPGYFFQIKLKTRTCVQIQINYCISVVPDDAKLVIL